MRLLAKSVWTTEERLFILIGQNTDSDGLRLEACTCMYMYNDLSNRKGSAKK